MAALPQSNTERWWVVYVNNGTTHRMGVRTANGVTAAQASTFFQSWFNAHTSILNATTIQGLERALINSNVRNPFAYTGTAAWGLGTEIDSDGRPRAISYTGRSLDGRKSKLFLFGIKSFGEGDMRVDITENAAVASAVSLLNGANGVYLSISGQQPLWHQYANVGYNDHWTKEYRKG